MSTDPTQARVFTAAEAQTYAADPGSPTMLRLPLDMARCIAENMQAFATYSDAVAAKCTTDHGRKAAEEKALTLRAYARGLIDAAT